jgi:cbb3-type cytochrome oxidase maturation protein
LLTYAEVLSLALHFFPLFVKVIFILIGASLLLAVGFLIAYFWAIRSGQYEDDQSPSVRILFDDELKDNSNQ